MKLRYIVLMIFFLVSLHVQAQIDLSQLEKITSENAHRLERLAVFGRGTISTVAWSPNGSEVAVGGSAGVWIYQAENLQAEPIWLDKHTGHVNSVVYHPNDDLMFSAGSDSRLWVYDTSNYENAESYCFQGYDNEYALDCSAIYGLDFSSNGKFLAIALNDHIVIWDVEQREVVYRLFNNDVYHVKFALDDTVLVATPQGWGQTVQFWKLNSLSPSELNENATTLELDLPFGIWDTDVSADSQSVIITGFSTGDTGIGIIDVASQSLVYSQLESGNAVSYVSDTLIAGAYLAFNDGSTARYDVRLLNLETGTTQARIDTGRTAASDIVLSGDGHRLAIGTLNGDLYIYEMNSGVIATSSSGIGYYMWAVEFSSDRSLGIISGNGLNARTLTGGGSGGGNRIYLWNIATNTYQQETALDYRLSQMTDLQAISEDTFIVSGDNMYGLITWSPVSGFDDLIDFPIAYQRTYDIELSRDRRFLIASLSEMSDEAIAVIDLQNEPPQAEFYEVDDSDDPRFGFNRVAIRPNQYKFSVSTFTGQVYNWVIEKPESYQIIAEGVDSSIAYSRDGSVFVTVMNSGFGDLEITLYDTETMTPSRTISAEDISFHNLVFGTSSDILFGSNLGRLVIWFLQDDKKPIIFKAHNDGTGLVLNQSGTLLASYSHDGTVQIWGIPSN